MNNNVYIIRLAFNNMIIGLTGTIAAGKEIIANYFKNKGFAYFSLSHVVREEATKLGIKHERKLLQDVGNMLRENYGNNALVLKLLNRIESSKNVIIDSIRNTAEIEELRKLDDFYLIAIDSQLDIRFKRSQLRNRESDPKTYEQFLIDEARDREEDIENGQQVEKCIKMADFFIYNNSSLDNLNNKIEEIYKKLNLNTRL